MRLIETCGVEGCGAVVTMTFTDHGEVIAKRCRKHGRKILKMLRIASRMHGTGVPGDKALDWAVRHVNKES